MRPRLLLFDIDGTLMHAGDIGRQTFIAALVSHGATPKVVDNIRFAGMTDRGIMRAALTGSGLPADEITVTRLLERYVDNLEASLKNGGAMQCSLCPGVVPLLELLAGLPHIRLGLGTGNVEWGAWLKLKVVQLHRHFAFGGFGSDHEDRGEVLRVAAQRGAQAERLPLSSCDVVVIGDTPRDIAAAKAINAPCLAVATGGFHRGTLYAEGATWVVEDLRDPRVARLLS